MDTYNKLNEYLKTKFNERVLKICIDASFTCPNRDGYKSFGGCIFCNERGAGERLERLSIKEQVTKYLNSERSKRANKYIVYFQNFSNTYDTISNLKRKYDEALLSEKIVAIDIDTRCDLITRDICELLKSYKDKYHVFVELGLQTSNEETHKFLNQQITNDDFINAITLLNEYNIDTIIHIMVGLPNENHNDLVNTINFINRYNYQGIKIHSTYVLKNTKLNDLYQKGLYTPISYEYYMDELVYILTHIKEDVVVHRITGDPPKNDLVEPKWTTHKKLVLNNIDKLLKSQNLKQGSLYKKEK